ncbi:hypothetical protein [Vibrio azureus]|uniref:FTP domain-containing protein n=1 Tax=Vibrio azureus NBRC 104587 TaxID=1219077 RepID=U3CFL4_9VIBR|nr:hypothetical protein [Vibrio azureus]GAD77083.1 hypothetical protein VAZ01S_060_00330 [Vibrio azureus NBRC 104587]
MRNVILLSLVPFAFVSQAAQVVEYTQTDLSRALNIAGESHYTSISTELSYQNMNQVDIGQKTLVRKQQLHYGVPVYGQSVVVELSATGFVQSIDGNVVVGIENDLNSTIPMISVNQAIEIATGIHHDFTSNAPSENDAHAELMIWLDEQNIAYLIYKIDAVKMNNLHHSHFITLVDAKSGEIMDQWEAHQTSGLQEQCESLQEWSPYDYYSEGSSVKYWGNRFIAIQDSWGADPYQNYWFWSFEGSCIDD